MRRFLPFIALAAFGSFTPALGQNTPSPANGAPKLETLHQKGSYAIGVSIGSQLAEEGVEPDIDAFVAGLRDALAGNESKIPMRELQQVMADFQEDLEQKAEVKRKQLGAANLKAGQEFLAQNARRKGVVTLPSGLQYEILVDGEGAVPKATDTVRTHYKGTLIDGAVFDSSHDRGQPAEFQVGGVIKGWVEALQLMKVGSKWKLFVPSDLAYGERGAGRKIGPNAVLIFEVELLGIEEAPRERPLPLKN